MDGSPLARGTIVFIPTATGAQVAPAKEGDASSVAGTTAISLPIADGKFAVEQARGLVPGSYTVKVSGIDATAVPDVAAGLEPAPPPETIPRRYNTATKLTAEVKDGESNTFEFKLTTK